MSGEITVTETVVSVNPTVSPVIVTVTESPVAVTTSNVGIQGPTGAQGSSGVISVTAPITNIGTSTSANIGIDQTALSIQPSQVAGTAVITTDSRLSNARTPTAHATTHNATGSDPVAIASTQITDKGSANGVATLDGSGLIPTTQLPPLAINDTFVVASQAAMLALTAQVGDVAVRTDTNFTYILQTSPPSVLANWVKILTPPAVTSVTASAPLTGGVITSTGTIGLDQTALAITNGQVSGLGTASTKDTPATGNATSSQVVLGSDTRLTDARTPTAHASTHGVAGSDPITIAESQVTNLTTDLAGKAATGANSDITSLSGLTTPLSVGQGGTGQATLTSGNALIGNGTSGVTTTAVATDGSANTIVKTSPVGSITASNQINVNAGASSGAIRLLGSTSGASLIQAPTVASGTQTLPTTSGTLVNTTGASFTGSVSVSGTGNGVTVSGTGGVTAGSGGVTSTGGAVVTGAGILIASSASSPPAAGTLQATTVSAGTVSSTGAITSGNSSGSNAGSVKIFSSSSGNLGTILQAVGTSSGVSNTLTLPSATGTLISDSNASSTTPIANGTATAGSSTNYARADHVHPILGSDESIFCVGTSNLTVSNPAVGATWSPLNLTNGALLTGGYLYEIEMYFVVQSTETANARILSINYPNSISGQQQWYTSTGLSTATLPATVVGTTINFTSQNIAASITTAGTYVREIYGKGYGSVVSDTYLNPLLKFSAGTITSITTYNGSFMKVKRIAPLASGSNLNTGSWS